MKLFLILFLLVCLLCLSSAAFAETGLPELPEKLPMEYRKTIQDGGLVQKIYRKSVQDGGLVQRIEYPSKDYYGDRAEIIKPALVYLPACYSEENQYDLLVLCHGVGGTEREWGFLSNPSMGKNLVDNLIAKGEIRHLIIVMPNGRSTKDCGNTDWSNMQAFYSFGQEIRNDLLPWMDEHYATYGDPDHRYMAGLSMGGMQTINIGLCECLDLFSAFGAFSAAPTSYPAAKVASEIKKFDNCPIRFFYNVCGIQDTTAYASASGAAKDLLKYTDQLTEDNWYWQECTGTHSFEIWNLGLFNFLRILGK